MGAARSRSGCLSCRRRKKKCDEKKPICTACLRNNLGCVWPDPSTQDGQFASQLHGLSTRPAAESDAWAFAFVGARPNLPTTTIPSSLSHLVLPGSVSPVSETWTLLDHYLKDTANHLACLQDSRNPFLHTILPAALDDELLMNSILALSGTHLMQRNPHLSREIQTLTWSSYRRALKQLRVALSMAFGGRGERRNDEDIWNILLVVLIFYLLEATRGNDPKAMQGHLDGAHHLMGYLSGSKSSLSQTNIVSLTMELYVYNASLASFTTNYKPTALPMSLTINPNVFTGSNIGVMCGCAYELFTYVPKVSELLWELASNQIASLEDRYTAQYHYLKAQIESWRPQSQEKDMVLCAELYQQSLLLLLDFHFSGHRSQSLDASFLNLKMILSRLSPSSPMSTTVTWPLFAFGMMAHHDRFKELIRSYLQSLVSIFGMGVMSTALAQLEQAWQINHGEDDIGTFFMNQNNLPLIC
ncbi:hypothetical protein N7478_004448 [Penicillium angulare]|uniref:uncharacterized protein n=1 Tax=Penicillium angulare TaxID=116970 RepID=UPI002540F3A0|nr:uncharacterized protein N7478_004448 [Penicillium angulare]KAJ5279076.1 hypothetical protein N7478_004448 [Penicillium angulare]